VNVAPTELRKKSTISDTSDGLFSWDRCAVPFSEKLICIWVKKKQYLIFIDRQYAVVF
jgi:hypothetical protein